MTRSRFLSASFVLSWLASSIALGSDGPADVNGVYPAVGAYYEYFVLLPPDVVENREELVAWANRAVQVATG